MTNLVYKCEAQSQGRAHAALARVFASEDALFDRQAELAAFLAVSRRDLGPKLLALFGNGRIEQFLTHHDTLTAGGIRDARLSAAIAEAMAKFHFCMTSEMCRPAAGGTAQGPLVGPQQPLNWDRVLRWLQLAADAWGPAASELQLDTIAQEVQALQAALAARHPTTWTAFCHNDLQYGNIMHLPAPTPCAATPPLIPPTHSRHRSNDLTDPSPAAPPTSIPSPGHAPIPSQNGTSTDPIVLIDYEYAGFNAAPFDIANHWCEWAANYHTPTPHLLDFATFPSAPQQRAFAAAYLRSLLALRFSSSSPEAPSPHASPPKAPATPATATPAPAPDHHPARDAAHHPRSILSKSSTPTSTPSTHPTPTPTPNPTCHPVPQAPTTTPTTPPAPPPPGLDAWLASLGLSPGAPPSAQRTALKEAAEKLVAAATDHVALSHLVWALWGYIQAKTSAVDFNFMAYARQRREQYELCCRRLLGTTPAPAAAAAAAAAPPPSACPAALLAPLRRLHEVPAAF